MIRRAPETRHRRARSRLRGGAPILAAAGIILCAPAARAQSMDYGALEQLFGEPVTTSATGSPQRAADVPANMTIITAEDIRRSGARDIPSILRHVAGIDLLQWLADDADVSIRGYDQSFSSRTLVLIDGRQVYSDFYGSVPWSSLPVELSAIRQIEIVRGPAAALFGMNAVGGVINIITYSPRYDDVDAATASAGTQGFGEVTGVTTIKLGKESGLRLSGDEETDHEFATPVPASMAGLERPQNGRAAVDADSAIALSETVELDIEASHSRAAINQLTNVVAPALYETNSLETRLLADTQWGLFKFSGYTNWIADSSREPGSLGPLAFDNRVTVAQAEDTFNLGTDHTVRLALEYRYNTDNTSPFTGGTVSYNAMSASGMWNWRIAPTLSLTTAARVDHQMLDRSGALPLDYPLTNSDWNRSLTEPSANVGLVWRPDDVDTLRLLASQGAQMPSLANFGAFVADSSVVHLTGTPTVLASTVTNFETAWDRSVSALDASVRVSVFNQHTGNIIATFGSVLPGPNAIYLAAANIGASDADGAEVSMQGQFAKDWRWSVSDRAEYISDHFPTFAENGADYTDFAHTTPRQLVKASLGWSHDAWEADAFLGFQSNTSGLRLSGFGGTTLVPIGAYATFDGRVAYRFADWATIALSGQNLMQPTQTQTSGPKIERRVLATLTLRD